MLRMLTLALLLVVIIPLVRALVIALLKGVAALLSQAGQTPSNPAPPRSSPSRSAAPAGGELRRDPVCGTYVSAASAPKSQVGTQTFFYCSAECRDKHVLAAR